MFKDLKKIYKIITYKSFMSRVFPEIYQLRELVGPIIVSNSNSYLIYVRPQNCLITPIWYRFDRLNLEWSWTPYGTLDRWIPIHQLTVPDGFWKGQKPAKPNIEIIRYLQNVDNYELFKNTQYSLTVKASVEIPSKFS